MLLPLRGVVLLLVLLLVLLVLQVLCSSRLFWNSTANVTNAYQSIRQGESNTQ